MSNKRKPNPDFLEMGYRIGDRIAYGETGDSITVLSGRLVRCDGHEYSWTAAWKYMKRKHPGTRGMADFHVAGDRVTSRYSQTYD